MGDEDPPGDDLQRQIDELSERVAGNRAEIEALEVRADAARDRTDEVEARVEVDRELISELQADGVLSQQHAEQMEQALRSSRKIGAAIGILMASRQVSEDEAFNLLREASQHSNRKLRDIADELVRGTGRSDLS